ncbi:MAG: 4a-hydroxytetrahydrobiopterin dehydratase [Caldilineaceae bacterium]|nr:4a-hydroxytetrahydrobiopterin dehydratase [Caldilineaceae bacterium]MCB9160571.1 4a-hydroxytetrahydrobiopterin dehydratase [Caldilineaceae bacterium]
MANAQKLSQSELATALTDLDGWSVEEGKLHREFRFADFTAAFGFMTKVAIEANTMDHHPEFFNVWNKVVIDLVTHEADDSISNLDVKLAHTIDKLAK